jgi:phosphomannomutase
MLKRNAVLGGEGNGGVIDPRVGLVRDSFVAMALILERMAEDGKLIPLADLIKDFPPLTIKKTKLMLPPGWSQSDIDESFHRVAHAFPGATVSRLDGVRVECADGWVLVRASNTEPIVRIIAEATDGQRAMSIIEQARKALLAQ